MPVTLLLLVGSNPLPNYLSACALRPDRCSLVYTAETTEAKDRLKHELSLALPGSTLDEVLVADATCATSVTRAIRELVQGCTVGEVRLNYTGGTKVMAARARMAFKDLGGSDCHASYLDDGGTKNNPRLRFDDGTSKELADCGVPLTMETILRLHGLSFKPRSQKDQGPTSADASNILVKVLGNVKLAGILYSEHLRLKDLKTIAEAVASPFIPGNLGLTLSQKQIPLGSEMNRRTREQWCDFIAGEWLEEWLGQALRELKLTPKPEIAVGVDAWRGKSRAQLEVDIVVIRGHRSYFISCTTDTTKLLCKSKVFEVAVRASQLGGELARAALVCLAEDTVVGALKDDINDVWGATNTTQVFGVSDLKTWAGHDGATPSWATLRKWLES